MQQVREGRGTLVSLDKLIWRLLGKNGITRVLSCCHGNLVCDLLALAQNYKVNFDAEVGSG